MIATVGAWRRQAAAELARSDPELAASLEADALLVHVLEVDRAWLFAHADDALPQAQCERADALLARRLSGTPLAYLLGFREFRSRRFEVTPDVLVPRDDTEILVDAGLDLCRSAHAALRRPVVVVDAGTGSGIVAISLALELDVPAFVVATDRSMAALRVAAANAATLHADVRFVQGDWLDGFAGGCVDVLLSNPPYIANGDPHLPSLAQEPIAALVAAEDGLSALRKLATAGTHALTRSGAIALEHGFDQGTAVRAALAASGYASIETRRDLGDRERVTHAVSPAGAGRGTDRSTPAVR